MDTKPFRELIEAVKEAIRDCELNDGKILRSTRNNCEEAIAAAERELAQAEKPYQDPIFHLDPATHIVTALPPEIGEALRLADEIIGDQMKWCPCRAHTCRTCRKARAYRAILAPINRTRRGLGV